MHYWALKNAASIDGQPAMKIGEYYSTKWNVDPLALKPFAKKHKRLNNVKQKLTEPNFVVGFIFGVTAALVAYRASRLYQQFVWSESVSHVL